MSNIKEKSINEMSATELRAALAEYDRNQEGEPPADILPGGLLPGASDAAVTVEGLAILRKRGADLTPTDRKYLEQEISRVLREQ
jgi:hypothetical protein